MAVVVVDSAVAAAATWAVAAVVPRWPMAVVDLAAAVRWRAAAPDLPAAAERVLRGRPARIISLPPAATLPARRAISPPAAISRPEGLTATTIAITSEAS